MNSSIMEDAGVPVIVDAVRDATKAVGSKLQGPIHKLHDVHVPNIHVPAVHVPIHRAKPKRRLSARNLMLLAGLGVVVGVIVMMRRRKADQIDT